MKRVSVAVLLLAVVGVGACGEEPPEMPRHHRDAKSWDQPPRPTTLSDPYDDHSQERCRELLATKDADLKWHDFAALFGPLPAGTFDEVVYFLPLAFAHLQDRRDGYAEYLDGFTYWISDNFENLARVGAARMVAAELRRTLRAWTASFVVTHYDEEACRAKGWVLKYDDIVDCSQWVAEMIHNLVKEEVFSGVAVAFVAELAEAKAATRAAWFLEFARWQAEGMFDTITGEPKSPADEEEHIALLREFMNDGEIVYDEEDLKGYRDSMRASDAVRSDAIVTMVRSEPLLRRAAEVVAGSDLFDPAATYWRDTLGLLGIER